MSNENKAVNPNPVKTLRELRQTLREETLKKAKAKAAKIKSPKKNEQAASSRNSKRKDLDL